MKTLGELYGPAMKITDPKKAREYFEYLVREIMTFPHSRKEAERIVRQNLGYYAGYYDAATMERVNRLFQTNPIFGRTCPTPEEALAAGKRAPGGQIQ